MLIVTTLFAVAVIAVIVYHMLGLHSPAELSAWTSALQVIGGVLVGLASLPYASGKITGSIGSIVSAIRGNEE
jgi:hypothetical protein